MAIKSRRPRRRSSIRGKFPPFARIAYRRFLPNKVIKVLLERKGPYRWYRRLAFTAFCAWVLDPGNTKLRRTSVIRDVRRIIASKEKLVRRMDDETLVLIKDAKVRSIELGPQFIEDIYYGVGGISAFHRDTSSDAMRNLLEKNYKKSILSIIELVKILHFHGVNNADDEIYNRPSLKLGAEALNAIGEISLPDNAPEQAIGLAPLRPKSIESYISKSAETICFLYAAADLKINDHETMLDHLFDNRRTRVPDQYGMLTNWLGRALYTRDEILGAIDSPNLRKADIIEFGDLQAIPVPVPNLSEQQQKAVHETFLSKRGQKVQSSARSNIETKTII